MAISRRGRPEVLLFHAVQPATVQEWPHFCREVVTDTFHSSEAKRALCILVTTAVVPDFAKEKMALVAIPLPLSAAGETAAMGHLLQVQQQPLTYRPVRTHTVHKQRRTAPGGYDVWSLHFPSKVLYGVAVQALRGMADVRFAEKGALPRPAVQRRESDGPLEGAFERTGAMQLDAHTGEEAGQPFTSSMTTTPLLSAVLLYFSRYIRKSISLLFFF